MPGPECANCVGELRQQCEALVESIKTGVGLAADYLQSGGLGLHSKEGSLEVLGGATEQALNAGAATMEIFTNNLYANLEHRGCLLNIVEVKQKIAG